MKKLLLSLGALATVVAPVAAVVACSSDDNKTDAGKDAGTTGSTGTTGGNNEGSKATFTSSKTSAELKEISQDDLSGKTPVQLDELFGWKEDQKFTYNGDAATWDAATLTVKFETKVLGHTIKSTFTIVPAPVVAAKATEKSFTTLADFSANSLVKLSPQTGDYLRNQFLFAPDSKALKNVLAASKYEDPTLVLVGTFLDSIETKLRDFLKTPNLDSKFSAILPEGITVGTFISTTADDTATDDDSILIGINGVDKDIAIAFVKAVVADESAKVDETDVTAKVTLDILKAISSAL